MLTPGSLASSAAPLPQPTQHGRLGSAAPDVEYEDLLGLWADLECALAVLLVIVALQVIGIVLGSLQASLWGAGAAVLAG